MYNKQEVVSRIRELTDQQRRELLESIVEVLFVTTDTQIPIKQATNEEFVVIELLREIGISTNLKGYSYLKVAIPYYKSHPNCLMTKQLYPDVARQLGTTASRVERAIRHAIEVSWSRIPIERVTEFFGCSIDPKRGYPTNWEFISRMAEFL